ncbi:MAG: adenylosuccinate synthetase [Gemmatales bacterium]
MQKMIVLLSGHVASGKSTLATLLHDRFNFEVIKTWQLLKSINPKIPQEREALQAFGELLDKETNGQWVVEQLEQLIRTRRDFTVVIDSVRHQGQIDFVRKGYGTSVIHVHLKAPQDVLTSRYKNRENKDIQELGSFAELLKNETEKAVPELEQSADVVVDTYLNSSEDVLTRAACHLGLFGRGYSRVVDVLVGGQYGSEGKGQIAAHLAPEYDVLVRVGGPNAGHSVYERPESVVFHSLPSGTLRSPRAQIVIGAGAVVNVDTLWREINDFQLEFDRLTIDPQVMTISNHDIEREKKNVAAIASTGQGVGSATARRILDRGDASVLLARDVEKLKPYVRPAREVIENACRRQQKVFLEGTQGTALSLYHGSYPYVTSRDTTVAGCLAEAGISPSRVRKVIMVCRTYPIRVQNPDGEGKTSGPMSQEISLEEIERRSGISLEVLKKTETTSTTRRKRRISEFSWSLLKMAAELNAPTDIALTFVDYISKVNQEARRFEQLTSETTRFIQEVERVTEAPVSLISTRFHHRCIIDRRTW